MFEEVPTLATANHLICLETMDYGVQRGLPVVLVQLDEEESTSIYKVRELIRSSVNDVLFDCVDTQEDVEALLKLRKWTEYSGRWHLYLSDLEVDNPSVRELVRECETVTVFLNQLAKNTDVRYAERWFSLCNTLGSRVSFHFRCSCEDDWTALRENILDKYSLTLITQKPLIFVELPDPNMRGSDGLSGLFGLTDAEILRYAHKKGVRFMWG